MRLPVHMLLFLYPVLLYKVVKFLFVCLKIALSTEPIDFSILGNLHIGPKLQILRMVLGYFTGLFLDARGTVASLLYKHIED